jgi:hypothetical protein
VTEKTRINLQQHHWQASDLDVIRAAIDAGQFDRAEPLLRHYLNDNPDDYRGQFLLGRLCISTERYAEARYLYEHLRTGHGDRAEVLMNLAKAYDLLLDWDRSAELYHKLLALDPNNLKALLGLSTIAVQVHDPEQALMWSDRALAVDPNSTQALSNRSFAYLQQRNFAEGWRHYEFGAGHLRWRQVVNYVGEARWQGETGKDVALIIHTEQGIGDQIAGIEPLRDAIAACNVVALDADPKMRAIFRRSFPEIPIHGREQIERAIKDGVLQPTHSAGIFSLHTHFRKAEEDYPKTPFLVANPTLRAMYRGWLDSLGGGLKIGLVLSGGHSLTHKGARNVPLDALLPILRQPHTFVSLEYRDRGADFADFYKRKAIRIHQNPHIAANVDFDEAAALIAELDLVIGVPGTAIHAAGALGTPAFCMVHKTPNIHYCNHGEQMPYYGSVRMFRREVDDFWVDTVDTVAAELMAFAGERWAA